MKRYRDWPVLWKIMVIPLFSLLLIAISLEVLVLPRIESWLMEQEKQKVRNVVEVAYQQLAQGARAVDEGRMTVEEAQKQVMARVKLIRYSGSEYFWINDLGPKMIMHPTKPELDGTDLTDYKDPKGKHLFQEFVKVCQEKGEGFVAYLWPKPGESQPVPKISYVKLYKPWGWIIGSGLYVDVFKNRLATLHRSIQFSMLFLSVALGILAWSVGRGIKRSLDQGCQFAASVASGDLTRTLAVTRHDEVGALGMSLNGMAAGLRQLIGKVDGTTSELARVSGTIGLASKSMVESAEQQETDVAEASQAAKDIHRLIDQVAGDVDGLSRLAADNSSSCLEMAASIDEVAQNMERLSDSVDGIGDSITNMTHSVRQIDASVQALTDATSNAASSVLEFDTSIRQIEAYAKESADISEMVKTDAEVGKMAVDETIAGMDGITEASRSTAEAITALSEKVQNIGSIATVIDEIAKQTSLLSLNASIIAAQAGEHGKGFGVVAMEIKQLAERTGRSTSEIENAIAEVQDVSARAVEAIRAAEESIKAGGKLSLKAGNALGKIVTGVAQNSRQMAEIARATKEQSRGSEMIRTAIDQVASMSTTIAQSTHQQRSATELIHGEVVRVRDLSSQVMRSIREQAGVSVQISRMSQDVSESSRRIKDACDEQRMGSLRIQCAVERIQQSAASVVAETRVVDTGVEQVGRSSSSLQDAMETFKLQS